MSGTLASKIRHYLQQLTVTAADKDAEVLCATVSNVPGVRTTLYYKRINVSQTVHCLLLDPLRGTPYSLNFVVHLLTDRSANVL